MVDLKSDASLPGSIVVHSHPLITHKLSMMRDAACETWNFRELTREIGAFLGFQASSTFEMEDAKIKLYPTKEEVPARVLDGKKAVVVPILRSGLTLGEGVLQAMPAAHVGHMGFRRLSNYEVDHHLIVLPEPSDRNFILCDVVVGTGNTACKAIETLIDLSVEPKMIQFLTILIAPAGATQIAKRFPGVKVHAISMEDYLDEKNHIYPGFGDPDARLFGIKPSL